MLKPKTVFIEDLVIDPAVQPRVALNESRIEEFAEGMRNGMSYPRIEVHMIANQPYLCDGFHRTPAAIRAGRETIEALVEHDSSRAKLMMRAVQANAIHGQPLTASERRNSVIRLVETLNKLGEPWTQQQIADATGYTQPQVSRILKAHFKDETPSERELGQAGYDEIRRSESQKVRDRDQARARRSPELKSPRAMDMDIQVKRAREHTDWMVTMLKQFRHRLKVVKEMPCGSEVRRVAGPIDQLLDEIWVLNDLRPMRVCDCQGVGCERCKHRGWLTNKESR
jgi:ParB-like chromosome segregation protein Spo0J